MLANLLAIVVGSLATACMMPFVALATVAVATMLRVRAATTIGAAWTCNTRVEDLLDRRYDEVFTFAVPGRAGYGGVRVSLQADGRTRAETR